MSVHHSIYVASKIIHAPMWRRYRDELGFNIVSTWIDEGNDPDLPDLWHRCISESAGAWTLVAYREPGEVLKGAWAEIGSALSHGKPVFAVGIEEFTISQHRRMQHFTTLDEAMKAADARR